MAVKQKKVLVFGTFDGIHGGHMYFLKEAKRLAKENGNLYVSVASDESIFTRKKRLPERKANARIKDVKELNIAKDVMLGDKVLGNWTAVKKIKPDIVALGYDQIELGKTLGKYKKDIEKKIGKTFVTKKINALEPKKLHSSILKKSCAYCTIPEIKARKIAENKYAWVFPTNIPIVPGHILISPKRCVGKFEDMTKEEVAAIFNLQSKLKIALQKTFGATGFNFAWNEGELAGQSVPHFHLHVLPRKIDDAGITKYEPRKFLYRPGPREKTPEKELLAISKLIKKNI